MKTNELIKIRKNLEKELDTKRFEHTLGVEFVAASLAMRYGVSVQDAQIAGLLHDCAKCISNDKKISICEKHNIEITLIERKNPFLLHAKVGSYLAEKDFDIKDKTILDAIRYHTTGRPNMTLLDKIVFIADYIEPARKQAPNLDEVRELAFEDLDAALIKVLHDTLYYLRESDGDMDPMTEETYKYYCKKLATK